jgi:uncharacterized membrane protein
MDVRETEEFKAHQKQTLAKLAAEEISAKNILSQMKRTEDLRKEVYSDYIIGTQGPMYFLVGLGCLFVFYTSTKKFSNMFPKAYEFFNRSYLPKIIVVLLCARLGIIAEQNKVELIIKYSLFKEYLSSYEYCQSLQERRLKTLSYTKRLELVTGINFSKYFNR